MSLDLTNEQLHRVRQGEPVAIRVPDVAGPLLLATQSHFGRIYRLLLEQIGDRNVQDLSAGELAEELDEALFMDAWLRAGRRASADQVREDASDAT